MSFTFDFTARDSSEGHADNSLKGNAYQKKAEEVPYTETVRVVVSMCLYENFKSKWSFRTIAMRPISGSFIQAKRCSVCSPGQRRHGLQ